MAVTACRCPEPTPAALPEPPRVLGVRCSRRGPTLPAPPEGLAKRVVRSVLTGLLLVIAALSWVFVKPKITDFSLPLGLIATAVLVWVIGRLTR